MGVDLDLYLSAQTRLRDFVEVAGALLGHPAKYVDHGDYHSCVVDGAEARVAEGQPDCLYQFESDGHPDDMVGPHVVLMRSNALNCALAKRLVEFFGGAVCYQDHDRKIDLRAEAPMLRYPGDGQSWEDFERLKSKVKALTWKDVKAAEKYAAYKGLDDLQAPWLKEKG